MVRNLAYNLNKEGRTRNFWENYFRFSGFFGKKCFRGNYYNLYIKKGFISDVTWSFFLIVKFSDFLEYFVDNQVLKLDFEAKKQIVVTILINYKQSMELTLDIANLNINIMLF